MPGDHITVNVELIARHLMEHNVTEKPKGAAADKLYRATASSHRLSRVPVHLRDINAEAYTPGFVAIGPLHNREDRRLRPAERLKVAYLNGLISRGHQDPALHLSVIQDYVRVVAAREQEARAMYVGEELTDIAADDFIQMMVLDGCFIIEHLVNVATGHDDPSLHATPFGPAQLFVDLVLAENQIPFFVLVDLITASKLPEFEITELAPPVLLVKLVLFYLAGETGRDMSEALPAAEEVSHILHLLHEMISATIRTWRELPAVMETAQEGAARLLRRLPLLLRRLSLLLFVPPLYLILPDDRKRSASYGREDVASASELKRLGVRFKKTRGVGRIFQEIGVAKVVLGPVPLAVKLRQDKDLLHLPQLRLEFRTAPLLLNLMAFEQSTMTARGVSAYVSFMAKMVQSAEDVGVLAAAGVLLLHGGAGNETKDEAARFFRAMGAASEAGGAGNDNKEGTERFFREIGARATSDAQSGGELPERSYLDEVLKKLRERSRHWLLVMWADVQRNYFTLLAELLTLVTFVSTLIQTYAAFRYH